MNFNLVNLGKSIKIHDFYDFLDFSKYSIQFLLLKTIIHLDKFIFEMNMEYAREKYSNSN